MALAIHRRADEDSENTRGIEFLQKSGSRGFPGAESWDERTGIIGQPYPNRENIDEMPVIDAHIHIQPFHMMKPDVQSTFWQKKNRAEFEALAEDPRRLLRQMDADDVEQVGLINYVSPDVMGFTAEA